MEEVASPVINSGISAKAHHKHYVLPPVTKGTKLFIYLANDSYNHSQQR